MKQTFTLFFILSFICVRAQQPIWDTVVYHEKIQHYKMYENGEGWATYNTNFGPEFTYTTDGGLHWELRKDPPNSVQKGNLVWIAGKNTDTLLCMVQNKNQIIDLYFSLDAAKTDWQYLGGKDLGSDITLRNTGQAMEVIHGNFIYGYTDNYINSTSKSSSIPFIFKNWGKDFIDLTSKLNLEIKTISGMHFLNDKVGLISLNSVSDGRAIYKTTDGGETWTKVYSNDPENVQVIDAQTLVAGGIQLEISKDGGTTWSSLNAPENGSTINPVGFYPTLWFFDKNCGVYVSKTNTYKIFRTEDGGASWSQDSLHEQLPKISRNEIYDLSALNCNTFFAIRHNQIISTNKLPFIGGGGNDHIATSQWIEGNIYPNPAQNIIYFKDQQPESALLIGLDGKKTYLNINNNMAEIPKIANGLYFIQYQVENTLYHSKILIQR